jgi:glycosyltransferase involved in cell wall biosynthesis
MRIGFDVTALYIARAGLRRYDTDLVRALLRHGAHHELLLVSYRPLHGDRVHPPSLNDVPGAHERIVHVGGIRVRRLARWPPLQESWLWALADLVDRTILWPWTALSEVVMRRNLRQALEGVDVFHSSDVLQWRQPGARNVITIHDLTALRHPEAHTPATRRLHRRKAAFARDTADLVIVISEATRRDVIAHLGLARDRIRLIYPGVDPAFRPVADRGALKQLLASRGLAPGEYILFVGTIEPRKNLLRLVEAYRQLRRGRSHVPRLVLAGAPGWGYQPVFERVAALGLSKSVVFLGHVPDPLLPALYSGAIVFVYPSLYEGFGLPVLEAMACGTPVVTSDTSSLPEVAGDAGVLVDPADVEALANALRTLLEDPDRRAALSADGRRRAATFTWDRAAQQTLAAYAGE